jgi:hypothetical protein
MVDKIEIKKFYTIIHTSCNATTIKDLGTGKNKFWRGKDFQVTESYMSNAERYYQTKLNFKFDNV